jgi:hypothetical protein
VQRNKRDLSQMEANSTDTMENDNNGGEVTDEPETTESPTTNKYTSNETTPERNKTYFYPKFVSFRLYF